MDRRSSLKILAASALGAALPGCGPREVERAAEAVRELDGSFESYTHRFFSDHEMRTVRVLADLVIPADERSGSATDARVPEFIDFMASEVADLQVPLRGGLAWLDRSTRESAGASFADAADGDRRHVLDAIAWPDVAAPGVSHGVRFFNLFRDLCASGFFTSRMGMEDVGYMGNSPAPEWSGCPDEAVAYVNRKAT